MKRSVQTVRRFAKTLLDVAAATDRAAAVRADRAELRRWLAEAPALGVFAACARLAAPRRAAAPCGSWRARPACNP